MTTRTPGTWKPVVFHGEGRSVIAVNTEGPTQIATMTEGNYADARLMASAPDLLLTLELLVLNYHDEGRAIQPGSPIWEAIHAAIAKAKGA